MKKIIILFVCILIYYNNAYSGWNSLSDPVRLTNGNNDRNPSFKNSATNSESILGLDWEFMAFERVTGNSSSICVTKINYHGALDSAVYLTADPYKNKNPEISFNKFYYHLGTTPKYAIVIWETNSEGLGRSSLYASSYKRDSGWSGPFVVDASLNNNIKPKIHALDSTKFLIVYESNNQIKYKKYDILSNVFTVEQTITSGNFHHSPYITNFRDQFNNIKTIVSYEKEISTFHRAIYFRAGTNDTISSIENPGDTVAYEGENFNQGFQMLSYARYNLFTSNRAGNFNIYATRISSAAASQIPVVLNTAYYNFNYVGVDYPITDNSFGNQNALYGNNRKRTGASEIVIKNIWSDDSVVHHLSSNQNYETKSAISSAILLNNNPLQRYWIVYNKDSSNSNYPSRIFGVNFTNSLSAVNPNPSMVLNSFSLSQNYPNPFNPVSIVKFGIPGSGFVSLGVFDAAGKEVAVLVNEQKNAGNYEVQFNGSNFPSGIYFYTLMVNGFSQTRRMVLVK